MAANGGQKVVIAWDPKHWVPVDDGINAKFTTAIGILVRGQAPLCHKGWLKVPETTKRDLREGLWVLFLL